MSTCPWCQESIELEQVKLPVSCQPVMHDECFIRCVIGTAAHQQQCGCYGGAAGDRTESSNPVHCLSQGEDPPNLSNRQAAVAAYLEFQWAPR